MKKVLVFGSTCVDVVIRIDHLPKTEENLHPDSQQFLIGGCAYNVANILGRAGAEMTFVTPVGLEGVFGGFVRDKLEALGFASPVFLPGQANGCCYCFVEKSGERTFMSIHGAEYTFDPAWMKPYESMHFDCAYVCGLEIEERTGGALVSWLERADIGTLFYAPGPRGAGIDKRLTERLFALHPVLHVNASEAIALSGCPDLHSAMDALFERTCSPVIATAGSRGAYLRDADGLHSIPGTPCENVADTIGAGDSHIGAILLGLTRGLSYIEAIRFANGVSAAVVATHGATLSDEDFARVCL